MLIEKSSSNLTKNHELNASFLTPSLPKLSTLKSSSKLDSSFQVKSQALRSKATSCKTLEKPNPALSKSYASLNLTSVKNSEETESPLKTPNLRRMNLKLVPNTFSKLMIRKKMNSSDVTKSCNITLPISTEMPAINKGKHA